jgi:hypothetical protein
MKCHIGVYRDANQPPDQWDGLIYLQDRRSAREFLDALTPFLREFHANEGMDDTGALSAWLAWHLIDSAAARSESFFEIALSKEIRSDIDFFFKVSSGLVEVFRIDEVLEWHPVVRADIPITAVGISTLQSTDIPDSD